MDKIPYQFRYYRNNLNNNPEGLTKEDLTSPNANIFDKFNKHFITQIGIQGTPGIQFKLNGSENWIEIGKTGIYELDLTDKGHIDSIIFNDNWALNHDNPGTKSFFLFIDILYKEGGSNK